MKEMRFGRLVLTPASTSRPPTCKMRWKLLPNWQILISKICVGFFRPRSCRSTRSGGQKSPRIAGNRSSVSFWPTDRVCILCSVFSALFSLLSSTAVNQWPNQTYFTAPFRNNRVARTPAAYLHSYIFIARHRVEDNTGQRKHEMRDNFPLEFVVKVPAAEEVDD